LLSICFCAAQIADFGFARALESPDDMTTTLCGSPLYMAPEILGYKSYDASADLWSVGGILFEMVTVSFSHTHTPAR